MDIITGVLAMAAGTLVIILEVLVLVSAWGPWSGKRWAWTLTVVLCRVGVLVFVAAAVTGRWLDLFGAPIQPYVIWYLYRPPRQGLPPQD